MSSRSTKSRYRAWNHLPEPPGQAPSGMIGAMNPPTGSAAVSAAPPPPPHGMRALFSVKDAPNRWPVGLRAAICVGAPLVAGWLTGQTSLGLMASLGAFTSLYGSGRPYLNRARYLALVALSFAWAVALGMTVEGIPLLVVPTVVVIAMVATYVCVVLRVGGPGAYMFTLTCAAGTALPTAGLAPWQAGLLVLSGGAFAWVVHMVPALLRPRGPEKHAVAAAGRAVSAYAQAVGTARAPGARHSAALALSAAWTALVTYQPARLPQGATLSRLQGINRELHLLFAETLRASELTETVGAAVAEKASSLGTAAGNPPPATWHGQSLPLGAPGIWEALRDGLRHGSVSRLVVLRVGAAALIAGIAAALLGLDRAYWAVAASVLILHAGMDWTRTLQRGAERLLGTWVGLLLAGAVLLVHPQGLWLVLVIMVVQFTIESTVMRNYALATVFITTAAITIASGGQKVGDVPGLLLARGVDTTIGCVIALLVFVVLTPRARLTRIPEALSKTLTATGKLSTAWRPAMSPPHGHSWPGAIFRWLRLTWQRRTPWPWAARPASGARPSRAGPRYLRPRTWPTVSCQRAGCLNRTTPR